MTERVLILDDEPDFAAFAEKSLIRDGHQTFCISKSTDTPSAIEEFSPTVVLLDIVMPELDGIEIVDWLSKTEYAGKVILISGYDPNYVKLTSRMATSKGLNVVAQLRKPVSAEMLREALRDAPQPRAS